MHAILNIVFRSEGKQKLRIHRTYIHHHFLGAFNFTLFFHVLLCIFKIVFSLYFHSTERNWFWIQKTANEKTWTKRNAYVHFSYNLMKKTKHLFFDISALIAARGELTREKKTFQWKVCIVRHSSLPFKFGSAFFFCLLFFT